MVCAVKFLTWILVVVHLGLFAWAATGMAELLFSRVPWPRISNPLFSDQMLLTQWLLSLGAALVFLSGLALGWRNMPAVLAVCYAAMAAVCAYQTFFILENASRFVAMGAEYAAYVAIVTFLFSTTHWQRLAGGS